VAGEQRSFESGEDGVVEPDYPGKALPPAAKLTEQVLADLLLHRTVFVAARAESAEREWTIHEHDGTSGLPPVKGGDPTYDRAFARPGRICRVHETSSFPDVVLTTERLTLRPFRPSDAAAVAAAVNDVETQTWLPLPRPYTSAHAERWCSVDALAAMTSGRGLVRAVESDARLAGAIDLKRTDWVARVTEIGYWTAPDARRKGLTTDAVRALATWVLRDMRFARVELRIATGNAASLRVAEKAGFVREGVARSAGYVHAGRVDLVIYSLIQADLDRA
jgi:RimJ/RimL family protein N-acetyltransferase